MFVIFTGNTKPLKLPKFNLLDHYEDIEELFKNSSSSYLALLHVMTHAIIKAIVYPFCLTFTVLPVRIYQDMDQLLTTRLLSRV